MNTPVSLFRQAYEEPGPGVAILLCTLNGQRFLVEQLTSIGSQTHRNWHVFASDDGSIDETRTILAQFQSQTEEEKVEIRNGPKRGFIANFLSLTCDPSVKADYYAFCDQDDIWECDKLSRALDWLTAIPQDRPALYCSRTRLIDEQGKALGLSPLFRREPSFANALVENIASGNTMVFNEAARQLLIKAGSSVDVPFHDWWLYLVVTACGGQVKCDPDPSLRYRQHGDNIVGINTSLAARLKNARMLLRGQLRSWTDSHIAALSQLRPYIAEPSRKAFDEFRHARDLGFSKRLLGILRSGVYRQRWFDNLGLVIAVIFKKI